MKHLACVELVWHPTSCPYGSGATCPQIWKVRATWRHLTSPLISMFCTPWFVLSVPPANAHSIMLSVVNTLPEPKSWPSAVSTQRQDSSSVESGRSKHGVDKDEHLVNRCSYNLKNELNWGKPNWNIKTWTLPYDAVRVDSSNHIGVVSHLLEPACTQVIFGTHSNLLTFESRFA